MIKDQLQADLKVAMKAKDQVRLRTIRSLRAAIMTKEIELRSGGEGEIPEQFEIAGRDDLKQIEVEELAIIEAYLPKQLEESEVRTEVEAIVQQTGAEGMKDMGKVMGAAMGRLKGKADGKIVQQVVRSILSGS